MTRQTRGFVWLLAGLQLLFVIAAIGGTGAYVYRLRNEILSQHLRTAEAQAKTLEDHLTQSLSLTNLTLAALPGLLPEPLPRAAGPLDRLLDESQRQLPHLRALSLASPDGRIFASSSADNIGRRIDPTVFHSAGAVGGELRLGGIWRGRNIGSGEPALPGQPIPPDALTFFPVLRTLGTEQGPMLAIASLNPEFFLNHISRHTRAEEASVDVMDYDGRVLWSSRLTQSPGVTALDQVRLARMRQREIGSVTHMTVDGHEVLMVYRASSMYPLFVAVYVDREAALAQWRDEAVATLTAIGLALAAFLLVTSLLTWRLIASLRQEQRMHEERQLAATVFRHSTDGILVTDARQRIIALNPALERISGFPAAQLLGQTPRLFSSGRHGVDFYRVMWDSLDRQGMWRGEIVNKRRDGALLNQWVTVSSVPDARGNVVNYVAVYQDTTEQHRQAHRLQRQLAGLRALNDVVVETGLSQLATLRKALHVGVAHLHLEFGILARVDDERQRCQVVAHCSPPGSLVEGQAFALEHTFCHEVLRHGDVLAVDAVDPDRPCHPELGLVTCVGAPVRVEGQVVGTVSFGSRQRGTEPPDAHDLEFVRMLARWAGAFLERSQAEERLHEAKNAAEAASVAKSRFLATMSHELRTPMNGVLGMAQLLMMDPVSDSERHDFARTIYQSGETLLSLLNDILDLSKVEAGKLELAPTAIDCGQLLEKTRALFAAAAQRKQLTLRCTWQGPASARYWGDPLRLQQVLSNLLSNAIKFTDHGAVEVTACERAVSGQTATLRFEVRDTGIGIPVAQQDRLFQPFSQVDASDTRRFSGTGLGLSIVRRLAELMGGAAGVESEEAVGSLFWFEVRLPLLDEGGEAMPAVTRGRSPAWAGEVDDPVLVVEDNPANARVVCALLKHQGLVSRTVSGGEAALRWLERGEPVSLILMDCQMPGLDGQETTRRIRRWEQRQGRLPLPIIAMTASAFTEDRDRCFAAGMDDFIAKPVDLGQLVMLLEKYLGRSERFAQRPAEGDAAQSLSGEELAKRVSELDELLSRNKYRAVQRLRELEGLLDGQAGQREIATIRRAAEQFRFADARARLEAVAVEQGWTSAPEAGSPRNEGEGYGPARTP